MKTRNITLGILKCIVSTQNTNNNRKRDFYFIYKVLDNIRNLVLSFNKYTQDILEKYPQKLNIENQKEMLLDMVPKHLNEPNQKENYFYY